MIIDFKLFESNIVIEQDDCYVIYGKENKIINVLKELINTTEIDIDNISDIINDVRHDIRRNRYPEYIGMFIFNDGGGDFDFKNKLTYWIFENIFEKNTAVKGFIKQQNYNFKGELRLENNNLILDDIEIYTDKYNL